MMLLLIVAGLTVAVFLILLTLGLCRQSAEGERFVEAYVAQRRAPRPIAARRAVKRAA